MTFNYKRALLALLVTSGALLWIGGLAGSFILAMEIKFFYLPAIYLILSVSIAMGFVDNKPGGVPPQ